MVDPECEWVYLNSKGLSGGQVRGQRRPGRRALRGSRPEMNPGFFRANQGYHGVTENTANKETLCFMIDKLKSVLKEVRAGGSGQLGSRRGASGTWLHCTRLFSCTGIPGLAQLQAEQLAPQELPGLSPAGAHVTERRYTVHWQSLPVLLPSHIPGPSPTQPEAIPQFSRVPNGSS